MGGTLFTVLSRNRRIADENGQLKIADVKTPVRQGHLQKNETFFQSLLFQDAAKKQTLFQ